MLRRLLLPALVFVFGAAYIIWAAMLGYALKSIFREFGAIPMLVAAAAQVLVIVPIAALFDRNHPPPHQ